MRETCARVLAAALMTGAIATAMGLPTLFESEGDLGRGLTAPPSSLQRSVRAPGLPVPARPPLAERLVDAVSGSRPISGTAVVRAEPSDAAVRAPRAQPRPAKAGQSPVPKPKPAPTPAPEPETRELASAAPPPAAPAPSAPPAAEDQGRGKNKKDKAGKGKGQDKKAAPAAAEPIEAAPAVGDEPPALETEPEQGAEAKEHGHGKGHGKGHDRKD